jgi:Putative peptidoglycan binding domain
MGDQELMHGARDKATSGWGLRRAGVAAVVAVLALAVVAVGQAVLGRPRPAVPAPQVATAMAPVTRGTVTQRIQIAGVLGFDGTHQVAHQGRAGILTAAAQPGAVVRRGGVLYRVDNQPVRLLFGTVPAYRDLAAGMPDGPDVHQLEQNLAALRLDPGRVDQRFTGATAAAIRRWQARVGTAGLAAYRGPAARGGGVRPGRAADRAGARRGRYFRGARRAGARGDLDAPGRDRAASGRPAAPRPHG